MGPVWKRLDFLGVAVHLYPQEQLSLLLGQSTVSTAVEAGVAAHVKADCPSGEDLDTGGENC